MKKNTPCRNSNQKISRRQIFSHGTGPVSFIHVAMLQRWNGKHTLQGGGRGARMRLRPRQLAAARALTSPATRHGRMSTYEVLSFIKNSRSGRWAESRSLCRRTHRRTRITSHAVSRAATRPVGHVPFPPAVTWLPSSVQPLEPPLKSLAAAFHLSSFHHVAPPITWPLRRVTVAIVLPLDQHSSALAVSRGPAGSGSEVTCCLLQIWDGSDERMDELSWHDLLFMFCCSFLSEAEVESQVDKKIHLHIHFFSCFVISVFVCDPAGLLWLRLHSLKPQMTCYYTHLLLTCFVFYLQLRSAFSDTGEQLYFEALDAWRMVSIIKKKLIISTELERENEKKNLILMGS